MSGPELGKTPEPATPGPGGKPAEVIGGAPANEDPRRDQGLAAYLPTVVDSVLAIVLALIVGAVMIALSSEEVLDTTSYFFSYPWDFFSEAGSAVGEGYKALLTGSVGSGNSIRITLERSAPLICAGLGVTVAFRAGLFNIGAQGQMLLGAAACGWIGFHYAMPSGLHTLMSLLGAMIVAAAWGGLVGLLKARTGAHEVITTIMFNYIASFIVFWLLGKESWQIPGQDQRQSPKVDDSASFPHLGDLHLGVLLAVVAGFGVWVLLERSKLGFEMRAVGANPEAARTAGMSVPKVYVAAMAVAGLLSGLAVSMTVLGLQNSVTVEIAGTVGFDAITVALLGRATPLGTVLAGLLFGALSAGGSAMQGAAGIAPELSQLLAALIVLFVAAPALVRGLFRVRGKSKGSTVVAQGWGS